MLFLKETHSCEINEKMTWNDDFKGKLFFLHWTTNSCGVAIGYSRAKYFRGKKNGKKWSPFTLDVAIDERNFLLVNLYNVNIEKDQLNTINDLIEMLKSVSNISANQIILGVDFNLYFDSLLESQHGNPKLKKIYYQNDWA